MKAKILAVILVAALMGAQGCASIATYNRNNQRATRRAITAMQTAGGAGIGVNLLEVGNFTLAELGWQAAAGVLDLGTAYLLFEAGRQYQDKGKASTNTTSAPRDHAHDINGDNNHIEYNY